VIKAITRDFLRRTSRASRAFSHHDGFAGIEVVSLAVIPGIQHLLSPLIPMCLIGLSAH